MLSYDISLLWYCALCKKDKLEFTAEYVDHLWMVGTIGNANLFYQSDINFCSVHNFYFIQDVIIPVSTAVIVTRHVPPTVKTTLVTYRVERVLIVHEDGLD